MMDEIQKQIACDFPMSQDVLSSRVIDFGCTLQQEMPCQRSKATKIAIVWLANAFSSLLRQTLDN